MKGHVLPICLLSLLSIAGGSGSWATGATAARLPVIGTAPGDCPGGTHFVSLVNLFDDGKAYGCYIGGAPAWLGGLSEPRATLHVNTATYERGYGWGRKVLFVLKRGFRLTVTLSGGSVKGRATIWFDAVEAGAPNGPTRQLPLNAERQTAFAGGAGPRQWPTFPGGITVPRAGCYYVKATWPGGTWRITFAAGR